MLLIKNVKELFNSLHTLNTNDVEIANWIAHYVDFSQIPYEDIEFLLGYINDIESTAIVFGNLSLDSQRKYLNNSGIDWKETLATNPNDPIIVVIKNAVCQTNSLIESLFIDYFIDKYSSGFSYATKWAYEPVKYMTNANMFIESAVDIPNSDLRKAYISYIINQLSQDNWYKYPFGDCYYYFEDLNVAKEYFDSCDGTDDEKAEWLAECHRF